MTVQSDLKKLIRARKARTGESYATARAHIMRERAAVLDVGDGPAVGRPRRLEAAVLKVNQQSARMRILGDGQQVTFRSSDIRDIFPGQIVTLVPDRQWSWRGDAYASGAIENARIDVAKLGLEPLRLEGGDLDDVAAWSEPFDPSDPYAPLWERLTARSRPSFEFDGIAWGELPGHEDDENPTCQAAELAEAGHEEEAIDLLMNVLCTDLRCLDAHAHLGNWAFERSPKHAIVHYEIGMRIGELSLPPDFDGLLLWGNIYNRPFLRCLHGYGLCLWRLKRLAEAQAMFDRILSLNPNDNQGVRFCWDEVRRGVRWAESKL